MIDKNLEVEVVNRGQGGVGYSLPEMNGLQRSFQPGESKMLTFEELEKLSWAPGGRYLLENELIVNNKEVIDYLLNGVEPEYYYSDDEVKFLLTEGTLEQLLDCLDFAPDGVIQLIKHYAVSLPCNDVAKRKAILDKTGFDVTNALRILAESEEDPSAQIISGRRAAPVIEKEEIKTEEPVRRSKYTVKK